MYPKLFEILSKVITALLCVALLALMPGAAFHALAVAGDITRISVSSSGEQGNGYSRSADISDDGRFVVFRSFASNLVAGDTNEDEDIFLRDRQTNVTSRISVSSSGSQADHGSYYPAISGDGRFVAFQSEATNLVSGDTNGFIDIFVRDRQTNTTTRVSVSSNGQQGDDNSNSYVSISSDGRFVAFNSDATNLVDGDTNNATDVFVHDRQTGITERISLDSSGTQGNGAAYDPSISSDGRFVAFSSSATNLVGGDTNGVSDIFVRDRQTDVTIRVSVNSNGVEADRVSRDAAISGDGRYVAFSSEANNLLLDEEPYGYPHIYIHDRQTGATTLVSKTTEGYQMVGWAEVPDISSDGRYIAFEFDDRGDGMPFRAIYVHDRLLGTTAQVSGVSGDESLSFGAALSADGRYVAFSSSSSRLVPNDTNGDVDIFLRELALVSLPVKTYQSIARYDGWILEAGEDSEVGNRIDERASTFFLGDANNDQQYRSVLHFGTDSLPNNAVITSASLKIKRQGLVGNNPFATLGDILVDVRKPYFDTAATLQSTDFQASADHTMVGTMPYSPGAIWYTAVLDPAAFQYINLIGPTQFRLRFALDDNDNNEQDYMKFYSGDADPANQPVLTLEYYFDSDGSPSVVGVLLADPNPTTDPHVRFTVAFSEPVTGVDPTDFVLTTTGSLRGTSVSSVSGSGDTYTVTVDTGTGSGTIRLDVLDNDTIRDLSDHRLGGNGLGNGNFSSGDVYTVGTSQSSLPTGWVGSVSISSDKNIVSVGRPHIGAEVASYDGFSAGSLTAYVPMLFKNAYGSYNSALYVQNVNAGSNASITVKYYDSDGNLKCTDSDTVAPLSSKGYWVPTVVCDSGSLDAGWVGGAVVTSDQPIVAVGRPHVGSEIMTYDGFTGGSLTSYIPMLFKGAYGGSYNAAFYLQNVSNTLASITMKYYDSDGTLKCTKGDTINPLASKGYWVPTAACDSGSLPAGWIGGVVVTSDQPIVGVGRPHIGSQVTTYNGFTGGSTNAYIPMLFKGTFSGTYNAAFYLQNTTSNTATVTIKYYSSMGSLDCTKTDTIKPLASKGYWVPSATCDVGSLPAAWVGGVVVTSTQPVVGVGRPHIGEQVTTYNSFAAGSADMYLPMLFKAAYGGTYNSAFYVQNTESADATITVKFYDDTGHLSCTYTDILSALATKGYWVPSVSCDP